MHCSSNKMTNTNALLKYCDVEGGSDGVQWQGKNEDHVIAVECKQFFFRSRKG